MVLKAGRAQAKLQTAPLSGVSIPVFRPPLADHPVLPLKSHLLETAKKRFKLAALRWISRGRTPVVVASIGRVGSTIVWSAIANGRAASLPGPRWLVNGHAVRTVAWDLSSHRLDTGFVYKTHDLPYGILPEDGVKAVFVYGRPSDVILSLLHQRGKMGAAWIDRHFSHLRAKGRYDAMFTSDVLRFGEQLSAWPTATNAQVLGLRYETLWDNLDVLSDFVQFRVELPPRRKRRKSLASPEEIEKIRTAYAELDDKAAMLPDYFRSGPS